MNLLFDGNLILYRCLYADKDSDPKVRFLKVLRNVVLEYSGTRAVVVWDSGERSKRRLAILPTYKERDTPTEIREAFQAHQEELIPVLKRLGLRNIVVPGLEGDDVLSFLALALKQETKDRTMVVSEDGDFVQLLHMDVEVYRPFTNKYWTSVLYAQENEVPVQSVLIYKAIVGDDSDNIPGVPGVGKKTATDVLRESKAANLVELLSAVEGATGRAQKIAEHFHIVKRNVDLLDVRKETIAPEIQDMLLTGVQRKVTIDPSVVETLLEWHVVHSPFSADQWIVPFLALGGGR